MKVDVLGVKINSESKSDILEKIRLRLNDGKSIFVVTPYSESLVAAQKDEEFRNILNSADFALPDGAGVVWAAKFLSASSSPDEGRSKRRGFERIPGREFFWDLCALAESRGESVFLLGGFEDTPEIVAAKLKAKFPNLKIAGTYNDINLSFPRKRESSRHPELDSGSLDSGSEAGMTERVIQAINISNPSFLFVALGPIRQEKWIYHNLPNLHIKLAMGIGGTFDYIAGKRPLPPHFLALHGLEWLWRLATQPWRVWRICKGVLGLIWYVFRAKVSLTRRTKSDES